MFRFEYCGFGGYTEPVDEDAWMTQNITDLNESGSDPDALVNNPTESVSKPESPPEADLVLERELKSRASELRHPSPPHPQQSAAAAAPQQQQSAARTVASPTRDVRSSPNRKQRGGSVEGSPSSRREQQASRTESEFQDYASSVTVRRIARQPQSHLHAWLISHDLGKYFKSLDNLGAKKVSDLAFVTAEDLQDLGLTPAECARLQVRVG